MTEAERDAYLLGIGRAVAEESEHTAKVISEWSAKVVTAMRLSAAQSRPYCIRCGIPHTDECRRGEQ